MIISMDLNASPLPEEDEEENIADHVELVTEEEHVETAVETLRREREERRRRLKREHPDEALRRAVQPPKNELVAQVRNPRSYERTKVPSGWLDCPGQGHAIGYIIPSKVPLGENFSDLIVPGKRYSLRQVIHQQRALARELGMVIDLTNTTRYYPPSDWKKQGIKHVKIPCKGRDAVPDNESVNIFVYEVLQYFSRQRHSKKYVLVHCTHGHNRTGFMIIHFLMRSQPVSVSEALQVFAEARPPGIYKDDYIDALYKFYHEERPETITCPPTPDWKRSSDLDLNGEAMLDEDDGGIADPLHEKDMENEVMSIDDVLGDAIPYDQQDAMRQFCLFSLKMPTSKGNQMFPGSHPVSLDRENLQLLRQRYYYATWKADGTRYMMLITCDGCYLIDRNFSFRRVQMRFPLKKTSEGLNERTHNLTLLDGEMVIDTLPTKKLARRYLIYDLMALNGQPVIELPFSERWKLIEKEVIEPRNYERQHILQSRNPNYRYELEPFRVRRKDFYLLSTVTKLLKEFIPRLSHAADGLIFQGWDDPYVPRTHEGLLKWKYPDMNSIDFLFEVGDDSSQLLYINQKGRKKLLEGERVVFKGESDLSLYSGKIIECNWDWEEQCWACMRIRTDKATPNDIGTYKKVMRSIEDNITEEVVLDEILEIISLPMYADRINSDSRAHGRRK
ncbi:Dual specificity phosphatase [Cinnamomum micranthum f. kanehirae]|uniref:mRNA guanylyltransferase n=1 Tax=Cinnamomum micranthum f. kanehirae TaxID=337451 RepID=A0A443P3J7_9MAGN|nr:Dual specificity phosphatase [Cinnamomum micranthum f. kanehirae]